MLRNFMSSKMLKSHSGNIDHSEPIPPAFVSEIGEIVRNFRDRL